MPYLVIGQLCSYTIIECNVLLNSFTPWIRYKIQNTVFHLLMFYGNQRLMYPCFRLSNCVGICNQTTCFTAPREKFSFSIFIIATKALDKHTTYKWHIQDFQGSSRPDNLTLEDGTHRLPLNVGNYQSTLHNIPEE